MPPSPESLGEGLVLVFAFQIPIFFDHFFSKDRADKVIKNHKLSKRPREDRADTGTPSSALRYVRVGKALVRVAPFNCSRNFKLKFIAVFDSKIK